MVQFAGGRNDMIEPRPDGPQPVVADASVAARSPWGQRRPVHWRERLLRSLSDVRRRDLLFFQSHGRLPRRRHPKTLMEKVNWRILYDHREVIAFTCDKLATKDFAATCPLVRVPRTLWFGTDLRALEEVELPARWILKPNNASGLVHLGSGPVGPDERTELAALTADWYPPATYRDLCEWAYAQARPVLLVEEHVGTSVPTDYKIFVFHGEPRIVQVDTDRFSDHRMSFYTADWRHLPAHSRFPRGPQLPPPPHLDQMLEAAKYLAKDVEFLRVDLYDADGEVWFGELTPYPGSGLMKISPARFDREWGALWRLPDLRA